MNDLQHIEHALTRGRLLKLSGSALVRQFWIAVKVCLVGLVATTSAATPTSTSPVTTSIAGALGGAPSSTAQSSAARSAGPSSGLLDPMEAFKPQVRQTGPTSLEVKFEIAPRYYLYRERLGLALIDGAADPRANRLSATESSKVDKAAEGGSKTLGVPATMRRLQMKMPEGKLIDDPTFGRVEVYEQSLVTTALIKQDKKQRGPVKLAVMSQGCAAEGVCFPPQRFEFSLPLWGPAPGLQDAAATWISPSKAETLGFGRRSASPR